jgi:hypothetical protein
MGWSRPMRQKDFTERVIDRAYGVVRATSVWISHCPWPIRVLLLPVWILELTFVTFFVIAPVVLFVGIPMMLWEEVSQ